MIRKGGVQKMLNEYFDWECEGYYYTLSSLTLFLSESAFGFS